MRWDRIRRAPRRARRLAIRVGLVSALASAQTAVAQTRPSVDVRTWRPPVDPEASVVLEPAVTGGPLRWNVGTWLIYAQDPVTARTPTNQVASRPLEHQLAADLTLGLGLGERAAVGLDLPVFLWQDGTSPLPPSIVSGGEVPTVGIGDVSVYGKVTALSNDRQGLHAGFGLAAIAAASLPTGDRASFMGEGAVTVSCRVLAEYALGVAAARASVGYTLRTEQRVWPYPGTNASVFGNGLPWAIGVVLKPKALWPSVDSDDRQLWELAAHGLLPAGPVAPFGSGASLLSPALLAFDDRISLGHSRDAYVIVGGDLGLDTAIGVPTGRLLLSVGWAPRNHDRDADGVPDDVDQCPDLPEDRDGIQDDDGCPEDDADGDGIADEEDACPLVPGAPSVDPKKNGCAAQGASVGPSAKPTTRSSK
jgi:OmpA-OmpF porin, OOP family